MMDNGIEFVVSSDSRYLHYSNDKLDIIVRKIDCNKAERVMSSLEPCNFINDEQLAYFHSSRDLHDNEISLESVPHLSSIELEHSHAETEHKMSIDDAVGDSREIVEQEYEMEIESSSAHEVCTIATKTNSNSSMKENCQGTNISDEDIAHKENKTMELNIVDTSTNDKQQKIQVIDGKTNTMELNIIDTSEPTTTMGALFHNRVKPKYTPEEIQNLNEIFHQAFNHQVSEETLQRRSKCLDFLLTTAKELFGRKALDIGVFGSAANGVGSEFSDIDCSISIRGASGKIALGKMGKVIGKSFPVMPILNARIPIIKVSYNGIDVDLSCNNNDAFENTGLLKAYSVIFPVFRPLVLTVKAWARENGMNDASKKGMNSYSWTLLVIVFLCQKNMMVTLQNDKLWRIPPDFGDIALDESNKHNFKDYVNLPDSLDLNWNPSESMIEGSPHFLPRLFKKFLKFISANVATKAFVPKLGNLVNKNRQDSKCFAIRDPFRANFNPGKSFKKKLKQFKSVSSNTLQSIEMNGLSFPSIFPRTAAGDVTEWKDIYKNETKKLEDEIERQKLLKERRDARKQRKIEKRNRRLALKQQQLQEYQKPEEEQGLQEQIQQQQLEIQGLKEEQIRQQLQQQQQEILQQQEQQEMKIEELEKQQIQEQSELQEEELLQKQQVEDQQIQEQLHDQEQQQKQHQEQIQEQSEEEPKQKQQEMEQPEQIQKSEQQQQQQEQIQKQQLQEQQMQLQLQQQQYQIQQQQQQLQQMQQQAAIQYQHQVEKVSYAIKYRNLKEFFLQKSTHVPSAEELSHININLIRKLQSASLNPICLRAAVAEIQSVNAPYLAHLSENEMLFDAFIKAYSTES